VNQRFFGDYREGSENRLKSGGAADEVSFDRDVRAEGASHA